MFAPVRACGRLSYELYLFHLVALGLLRTAAPPETTAGDLRLALLLVYAAASVAAAAAIAKLWSDPLNAALRRRRQPLHAT
jgi:peptidoglycan/LPS O-acetylase OafA/YrhL